MNTAAMLFVMCAFSLVAQEQSTLEGTIFRFAVPQNFRTTGSDAASKQNPAHITIGIAARAATSVRVRVVTAIDTTVHVVPEKVTYLVLDASTVQCPSASREPLNSSVLVTSASPVALTVTNSRYQTTESFRPWPVELLGTEYRLMAYTKLAPDLLSSATVTATADNTEIQVTSNTALAHYFPSVTLRKGQCIVLAPQWSETGPCDLTGTLIKASKPVSVVSGHTCAYVPVRIEACNTLLEQMPPVNRWGNQHFLSVPYARSVGYVRVLAHEEETVVTITDSAAQTLDAGSFIEFRITSPVHVSANKPILVAAFSTGYRIGDSVGDPAYNITPPASMFGSDCLVYSALPPSEWNTAAVVTGPAGTVSAVTIDGVVSKELAITRSADGTTESGVLRLDHRPRILTVPPGCSLVVWGAGVGVAAFDAWSYTPGWSPARVR